MINQPKEEGLAQVSLVFLILETIVWNTIGSQRFIAGVEAVVVAVVDAVLDAIHRGVKWCRLGGHPFSQVAKAYGGLREDRPISLPSVRERIRMLWVTPLKSCYRG